MKITIFTTGGTIDKLYFDELSEYQVGNSRIEQVLREAGATIEVEIRPLMRKDSLELTDDDRATVRRAVDECPTARILVTHGTDTMVETAWAIQGVAGKTVVLVGSMTPACFRETDAIFNVGFALAAVQLLRPGVHIAMNGRVFDPRRVRKNREKHCFEPVESEA